MRRGLWAFGMGSAWMGSAACTGPSDAEKAWTDPNDLRLDPADYAEYIGDGRLMPAPDVTIPAYTEIQYCYVDTWDGGDVGVVDYRQKQAYIGHHLMLGRLLDDGSSDWLTDGSLYDCGTEMGGDFPPFLPFLFPEALDPAEDLIPNLPEGVAVSLRDGERYVLQAHYINHSDQDLRVRDLAVLDVMPHADVETWASAWVMEAERFEVPPGERWSYSHSCRLEQDYHLLYLGGHMHGSGRAMVVDRISDDGSSAQIYSRPEWDPAWQVVPQFDAMGLDLGAADTLRTTCTWENEGDTPLTFPGEMCIGLGVVFPLEVTQVCKDWSWEDEGP